MIFTFITRFQDQIYQHWTTGIEEKCKFNLGQPLITRNQETQLISVNFDPQVSFIRFVIYRLYSELKYKLKYVL